MLSSYPACFFYDGDTYSVIFPDLNSLATCGETLEEAYSMAEECLAGYLCWLKRDGEAPLPPSSLEQVDMDREADGIPYVRERSFKRIISVDAVEYAKKHFEKSTPTNMILQAQPT